MSTVAIFTTKAAMSQMFDNARKFAFNSRYGPFGEREEIMAN